MSVILTVQAQSSARVVSTALQGLLGHNHAHLVLTEINPGFSLLKTAPVVRLGCFVTLLQLGVQLDLVMQAIYAFLAHIRPHQQTELLAKFVLLAVTVPAGRLNRHPALLVRLTTSAAPKHTKTALRAPLATTVATLGIPVHLVLARLGTTAPAALRIRCNLLYQPVSIRQQGRQLRFLVLGAPSSRQQHQDHA